LLTLYITPVFYVYMENLQEYWKHRDIRKKEKAREETNISQKPPVSLPPAR